MSRALLLAFTLASLGALPAAAAGELRVRLRPERLVAGELAELTFEISSSELRGLTVEPRFALDNLRVATGPSRRDSVTWVNGQLSRSLSLTWYLVPEAPGRARVHDIEVELGGRALTLPDQEAAVEEPSARAPRPDPPQRTDPLAQMLRDLLPRPRWAPRDLGEPQVLLRAEVAPELAWVGQQLRYVLYLLVERRREGEGRVSVETIFPRKVPQFQGFWSQEIPLPEHGRAEIVELEDKLWYRQAILQRALFPYGAGQPPIEAAEADLRLVYFRPLAFGLGEEPVRPAAVRRTSNAPVVTVRALPPAPGTFSGAVGRFRSRAELQPLAVRAGEGAVLTVELAGSGNLSGLPDPQLPRMPGLEPSAPQESTRHQVTGGQIESIRSWSWTLVPARAGRWTVPPVAWTTFEPASGRFETVATSPHVLAVAPAAPAPSPPPSPAREAPAGPTARRFERWRPWLPAIGAGAAASTTVLLAALLWRHTRHRRQPALRRLQARLAAAFGETQPRHAAGAAEAAWRDFLSERFKLPAGAPVTQWPQLLAEQHLQPTLAGELLRLVDDLHYLRYAPRLASTDSLQRELLERSRRLARRLA